MDKQKRTTIDEFSAYLQSAVRNTTINYMNDKSKIKEHEITLEEDLENVEGRGMK
jgi:DNA-directed RNA polymerase specialized sigma24 family protein